METCAGRWFNVDRMGKTTRSLLAFTDECESCVRADGDVACTHESLNVDLNGDVGTRERVGSQRGQFVLLIPL